MEYTKPLARLIEYFQKLPSIGPKTAMRLALHIIKMSEGEVSNFANLKSSLKTKNKFVWLKKESIPLVMDMLKVMRI